MKSAVRRALFPLAFIALLAAADQPGPLSASPAYTYPPLGTVLYPGVTGAALQDSIRAHYRPPVGLSYNSARDLMYTKIDNHEGQVTCVYTGFTISVDPQSATPRTDAFNAGINAEHTWPQSKGADHTPMEADLHHLFPSEINANAVRANWPFDEIPDAQTDTWYVNRTVTATPDPAHIDDYSEYDNSFPGTPYGGRWEPREVHEGNVARALFYFWTVYRAEATAGDPNFFNVQKNVLREWAHVDTADQAEYIRTCMVGDVQSGKPNPFVIDPTLADRAYFNDVPVVLSYFLAEPDPDGVRVRWEATVEGDYVGFDVIRSADGSETRLNLVPIPATGGRHEYVDRSGTPGVLYDYTLEAIRRDGVVERPGHHSARYPTVRPRLTLGPNPFRAGQSLTLAGSSEPPTAIDLFDAAGRRVQSFPDPAILANGWNGRLDSGAAIPPGIYFFRVRFGAEAFALRLVVTR